MKSLQSDPETISLLVRDSRSGEWLWFGEPLSILVAHQCSEVMPLLQDMEHQTQGQDRWAAGFLSYEAAPAMDSALRVNPSHEFPLAWFGIFTTPRTVSIPECGSSSAKTLDWKPSITSTQYESAIARIKQYIQAGDTYQVNFTFRLNTAFHSEPMPFFKQLIQAQNSDRGFFLDTPDWSVCSASPELFFEMRDQRLRCRPMKGTLSRGRWSEEDHAMAEQLRHSEKNRSENLMIVDMMRNDMGRIAEIGSVRVESLFDIEQYPTLWQMTSTIQCSTRASIPEIFRALFPAASITGAPKARTMQIIAELETAPRSIYTGTAGFVGPGRNAHFNVAIRTVQIDKLRARAEYGVGGGIVWDSTASSEFAECELKARLLTHSTPDFSLLETLSWSPSEGFFLLEEHMSRLRKSAAYFGFKIDEADIRTRLFRSVQFLPPLPHRIRLVVPNHDPPEVETSAITSATKPYTITLAKRPIDALNPFLYHKTTWRKTYTDLLQASPGYQDLLLWNHQDELTESCIANLLVEMSGEWVTPPVHCGLLPGVHRAHLLASGQIRERVIHVDELPKATGIRLINSLRKEWRISLL